MADGKNGFSQFLGGPPALVLLRLVILCVVVGVILAALGLDPRNILTSARRLVEHLASFGLDTLTGLWRYFLLGAIVVIPLWLIMRFSRGLR